MKVHFHSDDPIGTSFRREGVRAVRTMLRRLRWLVTDVRMRLDDVNGPEQGGVDKRCRLEVGVRGQSSVTVTALARSWRGAVDAVAAQLRRRVVVRLREASLPWRSPRRRRVAGTRLPRNAS